MTTSIAHLWQFVKSVFFRLARGAFVKYVRATEKPPSFVMFARVAVDFAREAQG